MSLSTDGFTLLGTLKVPSVTGSVSNVPVLIKYEDFTITMLSNLDSGGGDLRFSSDEGGDTRLPIEIVTFAKASGDVVWTKLPTVVTDTLIYVWGDNTGESQPAVGAAFGRNAVWSDFETMWHLDSGGVLVDATGNHDLTQSGSPTTAAGQIGDAVDCGGSYSNRFTATGYKGITGGGARTVSAWSKSTAGTDCGIVSWGENNNGNRWSVYLQAGKLRTEVQGGFKLSDTAVADNTFKRLTSIYNGVSYPSGVTHRTNGVAETSYTNGSNRAINTLATNDVIVAAFNNFGGATAGAYTSDEIAIRAFAISADQDLIEYQNQSAVGAWFIAEDAGGSTELTLSSISHNVSIGSITLTQNNVIIPNSTSQGTTLSLPVISQFSTLDLNSLSQGNTLESLTLIEQSSLPINSVSDSQTLQQPTIIQDYIVNVLSSSQGITLGNASLTGQSNLSVDNSFSVQTLHEITLLQDYGISVSSIGQGTTLQNLDLVQHNTLSISGLVNSTSLSNITLVTGDQLSIAGATQGNTLDNTTLTQANVLSVSSISNGNSLTEVLLTVAGILSISGVSQNQILDSVNLLQNYLLDVGSISNPSSISSVELVTGDILNLSDISTGTSISSVELLQNNIIIVNSLNHTQSVGVIFFKDIPDLGAYLISFKPDEIGISYSINLIQIQFGE